VNAGQAITRAMKLERNADLLAMIDMLSFLRHGLLGWMWGWYGPEVAVLGEPSRHLHNWQCPLSRWRREGRCSCSLLAYRTPAVERAAAEELVARLGTSLSVVEPVSAWWSYALTAVGVLGLYLAGLFGSSQVDP
jgi:hypothetical protein